MVVKILIVEGRHDAAFIGRILQANGYKNSKLKIGDYPQFIKGYLTKLFNNGHVDDSTVKDIVSNLFLPSSSLSLPPAHDELIIIFAMGGDSQKSRRVELIKNLNTLFQNDMFKSENDSLKIIYNLDSDEFGIIEREKQVNDELKEVISYNFPNVEHGKWIEFSNIFWGLYVFANPDSGKGKLEDLILPLIENNKQELKLMVDNFISKRPELNYWNTKHKQYDEEKARISMMCQMEISGSANTTLITKSGLIDDEALKSGVYKSLYDYIIS